MNTQAKVIGISGAAGSGKSTMATMISNLIPGTEIYSYANPIKEFVEAVFLFSKEALYGPSELREFPLAVGADYWPATLHRFWNLGGEFSREWLKACGRSPAGSNVGSLFVDWFDRVRHVCEKDPSRLTARYVCQQLGTEFGREVLDQDVWIKVGLDRISKSQAPLVVIPDARFDNEAQAIRNAGGEIWTVKRHTTKRVDAHASEAGINSRFVTRTFPNFGSLDSLRAEIKDALFLMGLIGE